MRRKDREVTDKEKIKTIIKECHCCRIGYNDNGKVYIVPLNFGESEDNGKMVFYFHSAKEGRKVELIEKAPKVGFEMDTNYQIKEADVACDFSARYQSVIGEGIVQIVEDEKEKIEGLKAIMKHATGKTDWKFEQKMLNAVCVFKLVVEKISCKQIV